MLRKQYLELAGEPVLLRAVRPFLAHPQVQSVVIALPAEDAEAPPQWLAELMGAPAGSRLHVVAGGETREASVRAALRALADDAPGKSGGAGGRGGEALDVVVVHDGARPLVTREIIDRCIAVAETGEGAVAGWPAVDTIKQVEGRRIIGTPDRRTLWHAQTPQAFPMKMLIDAYRRAEVEAEAGTRDAGEATDDSALVARYGGSIVMVEGAAGNIKVTRPEDMRIAEVLLGILERPGGKP